MNEVKVKMQYIVGSISIDVFKEKWRDCLNGTRLLNECFDVEVAHVKYCGIHVAMLAQREG